MFFDSLFDHKFSFLLFATILNCSFQSWLKLVIKLQILSVNSFTFNLLTLGTLFSWLFFNTSNLTRNHALIIKIQNQFFAKRNSLENSSPLLFPEQIAPKNLFWNCVILLYRILSNFLERNQPNNHNSKLYSASQKRTLIKSLRNHVTGCRTWDLYIGFLLFSRF